MLWRLAFGAIVACTSGSEPGSDATANEGAGASERARESPAMLYDGGVAPLWGAIEVVRGVFPSAEPVLLLDCDGDRALEVLRLGEGRLYEPHEDGAFTPRAQLLPSQLPPPAPPGFGPTNLAGAWADMDGDGERDLIAGRVPVVWLRGRSDCRFDAPQPLLTACGPYPPQHIFPTDANTDGRLDLALSCAGPGVPPFRLALAREDGGFDLADVPPAPFAELTPTWTPPTKGGLATFAWFLADIDTDGGLDGFFLADYVQGWFAWGVPGGLAFVRDDALGLALAAADAMSVAPLDFDRDGDADYFAACLGGRGNLLLRHDGGRALVDVAEAAHVRGDPVHTHWSSYATDIDFDGWTDVLTLVVDDDNMMSGKRQPVAPRVYMNQRDGTFADLSGLLVADGVAIAANQFTCGDLFGNGRVACFAPTFDLETVLIRNGVVPRGGWVGVEVEGPPGARVAIEGADPPLVVLAGPQAPTGALHDDRVLLAAGDREVVTLLVEWPSGAARRVLDVPVRQYVAVEEP